MDRPCFYEAGDASISAARCRSESGVNRYKYRVESMSCVRGHVLSLAIDDALILSAIILSIGQKAVRSRVLINSWLCFNNTKIFLWKSDRKYKLHLHIMNSKFSTFYIKNSIVAQMRSCKA
jgi:hypothetical protein